MSNKLKDLISVGQKLFFASDDNRINGRWKKTMTVIYIGSKYFEVEDERCNSYKVRLLPNAGVRIASIVTTGGASVFGYKDEETYNFYVKKSENILKISNHYFWQTLDEEKLAKVFEVLKDELA